MCFSKNSGSRIQLRKDLFVWGFVLVMMAAIAVGEVEQNPISQANEAVEIEISYGDKVSVAGEPNSKDLEDVSMDKAIQSSTFKKDTQIRDALRFLAVKYQKNIVPSPKVDGQLGFTSLFNLTFEEAMDAILGVNLKYEQVGQLIKVYTVEEYAKIREDKGRMIYKVFTLYYMSAAEAKKLVTPVLSGAGMIEASSPAEIGISLGGGGGDGEAGGDSTSLHDSVVIYDYPESIAKAEELITSIDIRPQQVLVEATILSVTLTEGMEFGVDLNLLDGVSLTGTAATDTFTTTTTVSRGTAATTPIKQIADGVAGSAIETAGFATSGSNGMRIGVTSGNVAAFITALESVTDTTLLANPKILALNKQVGTVFIGQKLGYRDSASISSSGVATEGEVKFLDTGTKLSFRPYIGNDGYIRMDIYPKDSSAELNVDNVPTETTAELTTNIMVKDGQTIVIGGLFRDVITSTRSQVPLLGDLPFIGAVFRGTNDASTRQEIIVMLTPHIISEPQDTPVEARAEDINRKRNAAKQGMEWFGRARLAEDHYARAAKGYLEGDNEIALKEVNSALEFRPTYLEALRLKERILEEIDPEGAAKIERRVLGVVEQKDSEKWLRR